MTKKIEGRSKYYYDFYRNTTSTANINPKMKISKEKLGLERTDDCRIPPYYKGKYHGYEARKVVEDFELTYNIGNAVTYLLRAHRKHDTPLDCIEKAIAHLEFELERLDLENEK